MKMLCIHQGSELYGSDRVFLQVCAALTQRGVVEAITVLLPSWGRLAEHLQGYSGIEVDVDPGLWVARRADLGLGAFVRLPRLLSGVRRAVARHRGYDFVYVSTLVVLDHIIALRMFKRPSAIHAHELPVGLERRVFGALLRAVGSNVIFNSYASSAAILPLRDDRRWILHNGSPVRGERPSGSASLNGDQPLRILCIGRIGGWKGQELLLAAARRAVREFGSRLSLRFVGTAFRAGCQRAAMLEHLVGAVEPDLSVESFGFAEDPGEHYRWADLVAVPSLRPEPFGLVAIEAMSWSRPVIAAAHGGLLETVQDGWNGLLFVPRSLESLSAKLVWADSHRGALKEMGVRGRYVHHRCFSQDAFEERLIEVITGIAGR